MRLKLRYLYRAYRYRLLVDPAELRFVGSQLQPGQVAVDVGCHKGAYTYWMRRRVGPGGAVFAFEPQPKQVDYLRRAFSAMRFDNVSVVPKAVSDRSGRLPLHLPEGAGLTHAASLEDHAANHRTEATTGAPAYSRLEVEVTTLDHFFSIEERQPDFIKIDVEGHESAVLAGAKSLIESRHPTLLVECESRHRADGAVNTLFSQLSEYGYQGSFFINGSRRPLSEFEPGKHQKLDPRTALPARGYVNNFAFVHEMRHANE